MRGSNPLFVDSTKFSGDGIRTQFELSGVLPYEDEKVFAKVTNREGHDQIVPLHGNEKGLFFGSIYLKHQEEITYRFYIKDEEEVVFESKPVSGRAGYLVIADWDPIAQQFPKREKVKPGSETDPEPLPEFEAQRKSLMNAVQAMENFFPEP
ncbi:MAG: hypothetical protein H6624_12080 [Bdellovibrionaceae bacterium]|nr:hypothetical protein [Bdellovibrionales bacterium]MCB9085080.1 hypothetical protein [Pseudobdellovibrionaceae bacterium]